MKLKPNRRSHTASAEQAAAVLMEAMPAIMQFVRTEMRNQRSDSLSVPQFRVLAFLSRSPDASLSEVADYIGITRASASTLVDRLVQKGLINRQEDPQERRQIMLTLTPQGQTDLTTMRTQTRQSIAQLLEQLTAAELDQVTTGLALLERVFTGE